MSQPHEIRHVGQSLASGGMKFFFTDVILRLQNAGSDRIEKIKNEINAYKTGFSFAKSSYPIEGVIKVNDIKPDNMKYIKNDDGGLVYLKLFPELKK